MGEQSLNADGLSQNRCPFSVDEPAWHLIGIARNVNDFRPVAHIERHVSDIDPMRLVRRELNVRQEKIEGWLAREEFHRLFAVSCIDHRVAGAFDRAHKEAAETVIVVEYQNRSRRDWFHVSTPKLPLHFGQAYCHNVKAAILDIRWYLRTHQRRSALP